VGRDHARAQLEFRISQAGSTQLVWVKKQQKSRISPNVYILTGALPYEVVSETEMFILMKKSTIFFFFVEMFLFV